MVEEFLEDINNILNSGEVPNLFEPDEYEQLIIGCRPAAKELGIAEGNRDAIYDFCINRVRNNLHIVLCMSPVGSAFRTRCRMFPSLVNCCTIDWFTEWPREALLSVSTSFFENVDLGEDSLKVGWIFFLSIWVSKVSFISSWYVILACSLMDRNVHFIKKNIVPKQ